MASKKITRKGGTKKSSTFKGPGKAKTLKVLATVKADKPEARKGTKAEIMLGLLRRDGGATNAEMMKATGWQTHSVRGFLAGHIKKKLGLEVTKTTEGDETRYSIPAAA